MRKTLTDSQKSTNIQQPLLPSFAIWLVSGENLPVRRADATTETLSVQAEERVLMPCQRSGIAGVRPLGIHPLFDHIRLVGAKGSDWLRFPMEQDPIYRSGQFPTPRGVLQHLKSVDRAGACFDSLYIAHEVAKGVAKRGNEAEVL